MIHKKIPTAFLFKLFLFSILFLFTITFGFSQEDHSNDKAFDKLKPGMDEMQVRETVGFPARIEPFLTIQKGTRDTSTYWIYNNLFTLVFTNHVLRIVEKDRVDLLNRIQQWADVHNKDNIRLIYGK